jgi:mannose-6-phosphate isomerase-like protein (cupin superfamily)
LGRSGTGFDHLADRVQQRAHADLGPTLGIAELAPDGTVGNPPHRHAPAEVYFVIEGEGIVTVDDVTSAVRTGTAVFVPGGAEHSLANTGSTTMRLLYSFAVDSFDDVEYRFSAAPPSPPADD